MNREPLVTVIIPTYQRPRLLPRAIESVRRQTYRNVEILVVDDASADDTREVVTKIGDQRIRYIRHEHNKGLPAVRNTGIRAARGEYVAFLDDDDEWTEQKLEKQLGVSDNFDAVFTGALINGRYLRLHGHSEVTLNDLRRGNIFPPSTLLVKTAAIRNVWFDEDLRQGEDWDGYIRLAQKYRIGYINEPLLLLTDGLHQRMTNEARDLPLPELEKRMAMLVKHEDFFGPYWFRRHTAAVILSYMMARRGKLQQLRYAIRRCGLLPVLAALAAKAARKLRCTMSDVRRSVLPATNKGVT